MLRSLIIAELRRIADKIEAGNCELSDSQAMDILSVITWMMRIIHMAMRKYGSI